MKCRTVIDKDREEEVVIYLHGENRISAEIEALLERHEKTLIGYGDSELLPIIPEDVVCFTTEENKVYAVLDEGRVKLKQRLYELEGIFDTGFVKINQSCIANISKIKKFDVSLGGALRVEFKNGYRDYVSRRQVRAVKERLGIK